jgi:hypothetical protein
MEHHYLRCARCGNYIAEYSGEPPDGGPTRSRKGMTRRAWWPMCACGLTGNKLDYRQALTYVAEGHLVLEIQRPLPPTWTQEQLDACEAAAERAPLLAKIERATLGIPHPVASKAERSADWWHERGESWEDDGSGLEWR